MLLASIFPAKQTQQKVMECSEISSPIVRTHKNPLRAHNFFPAGFHKKIAKFYGDVTLVKHYRLDCHKIKYLSVLEL
jgi:hypothetical protein